MQNLDFRNGKTVVVESLFDLCRVLNNIEREIYTEDGRGDINQVLYITSLPVFSDNEPEDIRNVYSWDDEYLLIPNESAHSKNDDYWLIVEREDDEE